MEEIIENVTESLEPMFEASEETSEPKASRFKDDPDYTKAIKFGWKDEGEYTGDPDLHLTPTKFIENHTWVKEIKRLKDEHTRDNAKNQAALEKLLEHNQRVERLGYEKALKEAEEKLDEAVLYGDTKRVREEFERVNELKNKTQEKPPEFQQQIHPNVAEWEQRNRHWISSNSPLHMSMKSYTDMRIQVLASQNPNADINETLSIIDNELKMNFPTVFSKQPQSIEAKRAEAKIPSVESSSIGATQGRKMSLNDLPKEDRDFALHLKRTTKNFNENDFIEQYRRIQGA